MIRIWDGPLTKRNMGHARVCLLASGSAKLVGITFGHCMLLHRWVVLILLSLALPLNGWASVSIAQPCPMQTMSASAHTGMSGMKGPCCDEHAKDHNKTGNPCKPGQECPTGTLYFSPARLQVTSVTQSSSPVIQPETQLATRVPAVVWRPPLTL